MLVVDLDNSLIRTDLLFETFFQALGRQPVEALAALGSLRDGKAALKRRLSEVAKIDASTLPVNEDVLALIEAERANGQKVALVSAADQSLVDAISERLGCFETAHGSDGTRNLGGEAKAAFLTERYGEGGFDYVGDREADLAVWRKARRAITVGASPSLKAQVDALGHEVQHLPDRRAWRGYVKALRPHQWLKNVLVFLPLVGSHEVSPHLWFAAFMTFVSFCLAASAVYVINDLMDLEGDRKHPRKRYRPFASGAVPIAHGPPLAMALIIGSVVLGLMVGRPIVVGIILTYFVLTLAYSMWLKRLLVVDICMLAAFYTLRVAAGGFATWLELSAWMLAFSCFLFLSLAAVKRQAELVSEGSKNPDGKITGRAYQMDDLPVLTMMAISAGYISVLVLALYIDSPDVRGLYWSPLRLYMVCPFLLFWISRTVLLAHRGQMHDDPLVFTLRDPVSIAAFAAAAGFALLAKYT